MTLRCCAGVMGCMASGGLHCHHYPCPPPNFYYPSTGTHSKSPLLSTTTSWPINQPILKILQNIMKLFPNCHSHQNCCCDRKMTINITIYADSGVYYSIIVYICCSYFLTLLSSKYVITFNFKNKIPRVRNKVWH
jgi:hypothetical protein